jgi:hypothetical protein
METIIKRAEELQRLLKANDKKIDNPVLILSVVCELENLIDFLKED